MQKSQAKQEGKYRFSEVNEVVDVKKLEDSQSDFYITAFDPKLQRRATFVVKEGKAISLLTGYSFDYKEVLT